jgi:hypothetical protein
MNSVKNLRSFLSIERKEIVMVRYPLHSKNDQKNSGGKPRQGHVLIGAI